MAMADGDGGDGIEFSIRSGGGYGRRIAVHVTRAALERLQGAAPASDLNSLSVLARNIEALSQLAMFMHHVGDANRVVVTAADVQAPACAPRAKR